MAHFAEMNENNEVIRIIVVANDILLNEQGVEQESLGIAFCENTFGGTWKQTSYNGNMRKNFAAIGGTFDSSRNAFIFQKPFKSWVLNETTCQWTSPVPMPVDEYFYSWDEETTSWKQFDTSINEKYNL